MVWRRRFSFQFKRQVVLAFEKVARRCPDWRVSKPFTASHPDADSEVRAGQFDNEVVDAVRTAEYEIKIAEVERKVGQRTMEVAFLKKARWVR